jgi:membrane associated rhomboid family serine protease
MLDDRPYMREAPFRSVYPLTFVLLIVNVAAFALQELLEARFGVPVTRYLGLSLKGVVQGHLWQFVTFQFLHGGLFHLVMNLIGLYFFGRAMEEALGRGRFLVLYLGSGIIGGLFHLVLSVATGQDAAVVGASAGVFGLVSAFATLFPHRQLTLLVFFVIPITLRARTLFWISIALGLLGLLSPSGNVAHGAHLGGIFAGWALVRSRTFREGWSIRWPAFRLPARRPRVLVRTGHAPQKSWGDEGAPVEGMEEHDYMSREVDPILDKISAQGLQSLTERERRILEAVRRRMSR